MATPIPARYTMSCLLAVALAILYGMKTNLSILLLFMIDGAKVHEKGQLVFRENCSRSNPLFMYAMNTTEKSSFDWDESTQGLLLSAYFIGFFVSQYPSFLITLKVDAKWLLFGCVLVNVVCCAILPLLCYALDYYGIILVRILQGIFAGPGVPCVHTMLERWVPQEEKAPLCFVIYSGTSLGMAFSTLIAGTVANAISWSFAFYVLALLTVPWLIVWAIIGNRNTMTARFITQSERDFIEENVDVGRVRAWEKRIKPPWRAVCKSVPFWAIIIAHFCNHIGWYYMLLDNPYIVMYVLQMTPVEVAGLISALYFFMWVFALDTSRLLYYLVQSGKLGVGGARKIANALSSVIPGVCILCMTFTTCDIHTFAVPLMVAMTTMGAMSAGVIANPIDISSNFAGEIIAITSTIATIPGIFLPIMFGYMLQDRVALEKWFPEFCLIFVAYMVMFVVFSLCASGMEQPWNEIEERR